MNYIDNDAGKRSVSINCPVLCLILQLRSSTVFLGRGGINHRKVNYLVTHGYNSYFTRGNQKLRFLVPANESKAIK